VGLLERCAQCLELVAVPLLEAGDLAGQGEDDAVLRVWWCGLGAGRAGLCPQVFDAPS